MKILLVNPDCRDEPVYVYAIYNDREGKEVKQLVGYANYDEHGSSGMEAVYDMARDIGKLLEKLDYENFEFEEVDSDEED